MKINKKLKNYIKKNILPCYYNNDCGHNLKHINYVLDRSNKFAKSCAYINYDILYTIVCFHDIGHHIDAKNHEIISADIMYKDNFLNSYFSSKELLIMKEAIIDHRASLQSQPRNIYGKIISTSDRNTSVNDILKRTCAYIIKHNPGFSLDEILKESKKHIEFKFGNNGYARHKIYFIDDKYEKFLKDINKLIHDDKFERKFLKVNKKLLKYRRN